MCSDQSRLDVNMAEMPCRIMVVPLSWGRCARPNFESAFPWCSTGLALWDYAMLAVLGGWVGSLDLVSLRWRCCGRWLLFGWLAEMYLVVSGPLTWFFLVFFYKCWQTIKRNLFLVEWKFRFSWLRFSDAVSQRQIFLLVAVSVLRCIVLNRNTW